MEGVPQIQIGNLIWVLEFFWQYVNSSIPPILQDPTSTFWSFKPSFGNIKRVVHPADGTVNQWTLHFYSNKDPSPKVGPTETMNIPYTMTLQGNPKWNLREPPNEPESAEMMSAVIEGCVWNMCFASKFMCWNALQPRLFPISGQ